MQKLIVKTLEQRGKTRALDRRFNLNSQNFLDIQVGLESQAFRYPVNLLFLDYKPIKSTILPWKWISTAIICALLTTLFTTLFVLPIEKLPLPALIANKNIDLSTILSLWLKPALACSSILMLISILASLRKIQKFIVLKTRCGQVPLVKFLDGVPNDNEVQNFVKEVQQRIAQVTKDCKHNMDDILAAELTGLRDLMEHRIVTAKVYNQAKQKLMEIHASLDRKVINKSKKQKLDLVQYH